MGRTDRISRHKKNMRKCILEATLQLGKQYGWTAVSMRKIADRIEYSTPVLYEYFNNKEHLLHEVSKKGFLVLCSKIKEACTTENKPEKKLFAMSTAYWEFALFEHELYTLMFGNGSTCYNFCKDMPEVLSMVSSFQTIIAELIGSGEKSELFIPQYSLMLWSLLHGLIDINLICEEIPKEINLEIVELAIKSIKLSSNIH